MFRPIRAQLAVLVLILTVAAPALQGQVTRRCTETQRLRGDGRTRFKLPDVSVKKCLAVNKKTGEVEQTCEFRNHGRVAVSFLFCNMIELQSGVANAMHQQKCSLDFDPATNKLVCVADPVPPAPHSPSFHFGCDVVQLQPAGAAGNADRKKLSGKGQSDHFKDTGAESYQVSYADIFDLGIAPNGFDAASCAGCFGPDLSINLEEGPTPLRLPGVAAGYWIMNKVPITDPYTRWQELGGTLHDREYRSLDEPLSVPSEFPAVCPDLGRTTPGTLPPPSYTQDLLLWDLFTMSDPPTAFTPVDILVQNSPLPPGVTIAADPESALVQGGSMEYGTITLGQPGEGLVPEGAQVDFSVDFVDPADHREQLWSQLGSAIQDTVPPLVGSHREEFDGIRNLQVEIAAEDATTPVVGANFFYSLDGGSTWQVEPLTPAIDPLEDPPANSFMASFPLHAAQGQRLDFFYHVQDCVLNDTWFGPGSSTITNCESRQPLCRIRPLSGVGVDVTVQDLDSGLRSIEITRQENADVTISPFPIATQDEILVMARKRANGQISRVELRLTDVCGNVTLCDPVLLTLVVREWGRPTVETVSGLPAAESRVTVRNGHPGLRKLRLEVNRQRVLVVDLRDGEERTFDISPAMRPGSKNSLKLAGRGRRGARAEVMIYE